MITVRMDAVLAAVVVVHVALNSYTLGGKLLIATVRIAWRGILTIKVDLQQDGEIQADLERWSGKGNTC